MDCIAIKKNREVPERLTGLKINLTFFKPLILRNTLLKNSDHMIGYIRHKKSFLECNIPPLLATPIVANHRQSPHRINAKHPSTKATSILFDE
jgi:hypothetical protein